MPSVTLDAWLVARLARELDAQMKDARIDSILTSSHDVIFFCYRRGKHFGLHARAESSNPLVGAYECERPEKQSGAHGWLGDVAALLRGARFESVRSIPGDRVLIADVSSRSAFGLPSRSRLIYELQPRKANVLVARTSHDGAQWVIVAAQKQFADGGVRRVSVGMPYEQPPPRRARLDRAQFIVAASQMSRDDAAGWERLLSAYDPLCTPALAREVLWRIAASKAPGHAALDAWSTLREEVRAALHSMGNVFEWRDGDRLVLCHLVELHWPTYRSRTRALLNELCTELLRKSSRPAAGAEAGLKKRLNIMLDRCKSQIERLESARNAAERADELRRAGETIYANLPAITAGTDRFVDAQGLAVALDPRLTAKENAAEFFRKYRKARSGLAAIENRLQTLRHNREFWEHLLWELERTDLNVAQRDEVHAQIAAAVRRKRTSKRRPAQAVRVQRMVELGGGAVALIGRSPADNERLTFSVARPQDYWFHARGVPGAHVIVKANGAQLEAAQVRRAAALAAAHSRADAATSVEVDYTRRKNVRRRGGGRTGLVWYTDFATIRVKPRLEQPAQQPAPKTSRLRTSKSGT